MPTGKSHEEILRYPEVGDFVGCLRLKNLSSRTIVEYRKVLRGLFRWLNALGHWVAVPVVSSA